LRVEDLDTGTLREIVTLPDDVYGEGLTIFAGRIYQLTLESRRCFVYDLTTRERIAEHTYSGEGWGLTHDDTSLWMSDGSAFLRVIDPSTFEVRRTLEVQDGGEPLTMLNELEWVRGELWANVWRTTRIARIDPQTGAVLGWIELAPIVEALALTEPEAVLNGIAWDAAADRIYVTGKLWPALYEIGLDL
jgi:glutamine cyclotransferase